MRGMLVALLLGAACMGALHAQDAVALRARHASLREQLATNQFQRPLVLVSSENAGDLKGEVYAVVDQPFALVGPALQGMDHWCDLLILHLNVKNCTTTSKPADVLTLFVGRKFDQPLDDAYQVNFNYRLVTSSADYLQVQLNADTGPMSTRNYRLALEAVPLDDKRTFIHMSYSYGYGMAARLAMQTYLATIGRDKIGFSIVGKDADGKPVFVDGVRGVVERNTMRYFLAIEAYLGAYAAPASDQVDKRLRDWFAATERYAPQLHEMERADYLDMKRHEVQRQQSAAKAAKPS